ncbi:hypothetical protein BV22DRAFT_1135613, partial [Leucogyrophana mollusca]
MPPKAPRPRATKEVRIDRGGEKKKAAKEPRENQRPKSFYLDRSPQDIVERLDPLIVSKSKREHRYAQARVGFARFDIVERRERLTFGRWNRRPLNPTQVQKLVDSFRSEGLDRFNSVYVIPLVVKKEYIKAGTTVETIDDMTAVPILDFSERTPDGYKADAAGGHHRQAALDAYNKAIALELESLAEEAKAIEKKDPETQTAEEMDWYNKLYRPQSAIYQGRLKYGGQWLVAVYDYDKLLADGDELALHLSQNQTVHVHTQYDNEALVMEMLILSACTSTERKTRLEEKRKGGTKNNKLTSIFMQDHAIDFLETLMKHGPHFIDAKEMTVPWMYSNILGPHGG